MRALIGVVALVLTLLWAAPAQAVSYVDLTPQGGESRAVDLSPGGVLVGNSAPATDGTVTGFVRSDSRVVRLGPLGPHAQAVNNTGDAVGCTAGGIGLYWHDGTITYLTRPGRSTCLYAINDDGVIAGASAAPGGGEQAFVWKGGTYTDLAAPAGRASTPIAINSRGQVLGKTFGTTASAPERAFLWDGGTLTDLGTLGGPYTTPVALGEDGSVAGTSSVDAKTAHPFRWAGGTMTDLLAGTGVTDPEAYAAGVNASGDVVGTVAKRPVLWRDGALTYLADAGEATAVNADGVVTGVVRGAGDLPAVFRWADGALETLPSLPGATYCYPAGIADDGTVAGNVTVGEVNHAVLWPAS